MFVWWVCVLSCFLNCFPSQTRRLDLCTAAEKPQCYTMLQAPVDEPLMFRVPNVGRTLRLPYSGRFWLLMEGTAYPKTNLDILNKLVFACLPACLLACLPACLPATSILKPPGERKTTERQKLLSSPSIPYPNSSYIRHVPYCAHTLGLSCLPNSN